MSKDLKAKRGTATGNVEFVIGQGAVALAKAVENAKAVISKVEEASQEVEKITNEVVLKKQELDSLSVQYTEKERQALLDLDLKVREKKKEIVDASMNELGLVAVNADEYNKLSEEVKRFRVDFNQSLTRETLAIREQAKKEYEAHASLMESQRKAETATLQANYDSSLKNIQFLSDHIKELQKQISDEREARVKEAVARGGAMVTVQNGGK